VFSIPSSLRSSIEGKAARPWRLSRCAIEADKAALGNTFEVIACEWMKLQEHSIKGSTFEREKSQLERFVFPVVGDRPVSQLTTPEILAILKKSRLVARATLLIECARRLRGYFAMRRRPVVPTASTLMT
jgi:hypothetical protein